MAKLRKFPYERLRAKVGTIGGFLFENRRAKVPRRLFHEIHVPNEPLELVNTDGKKQRTKTDLRLEFIELPDHPFRGYRALVGQTLEFPTNPEEGYIDATIYVCNAHNMIDVSELSFTALRRGLLEVTITLAFDFETEQTGYANSDALSVDVQLRPAPIRIDDEILKNAKGRNPRALLAPFVDPEILSEIVKDEGRTYVRLREV